MRAALLALVACGSSASPPPRGFLTAPPLRTTPHDPTKATLTGRVLLDGKPVRVFAVAIGDAGFVPNPGHRVHSARGQFSIPNLRPEPVNVWIAGPGFTPRKLRARATRE